MGGSTIQRHLPSNSSRLYNGALRIRYQQTGDARVAFDRALRGQRRTAGRRLGEDAQGARLLLEQVKGFKQAQRSVFRELAERVTRFVEDLDAVRERALVTQEEIASRLAEQMNARMYVLSLVAGVFLPLGLLTGLLGINVGGMPGEHSPLAFWIVCLILVATGAGLVWGLRRLRWL